MDNRKYAGMLPISLNPTNMSIVSRAWFNDNDTVISISGAIKENSNIILYSLKTHLPTRKLPFRRQDQSPTPLVMPRLPRFSQCHSLTCRLAAVAVLGVRSFALNHVTDEGNES